MSLVCLKQSFSLHHELSSRGASMNSSAEAKFEEVQDEFGLRDRLSLLA